MKFVIDNITNIIWNLSFFDNFVILIIKKKIIIVFAKAYIFYVFENIIDDFVKKKR